MPARAAYQLIHDELNLDGNPALNLASFVTTWMEPEAQQLATETLNRNFVDQDEYPQTEEIHHRVISMIGGLFNAPDEGEPVGTATIGSSEAIMLGLLAHKWSWRAQRGDDSARPNVVFGADVHTCWEKFARYFDVEQRVIPLTPDRHTIGPEQVEPLIDENTIAVGAILGTTFTGQIDDIEGIDELLRRVKQEKGWDIPIHVDARQRRLHRPLRLPRAEVGLPARAGALDQRLQPQVRARLPRHGHGRLPRHLGPCPRSWSSRSTTSAARWPTTASTSAAPATRCCCSTTTSFASATRATSGSSPT